MSFHKYFKSSNPNIGENRTLDTVPVAVTIAELTTTERNEVANQIRNSGKKHGSGEKKLYEKYDIRLRCEVAKFAMSGSNKSAARKYGIPVTTVHGFVKSYNEK